MAKEGGDGPARLSTAAGQYGDVLITAGCTGSASQAKKCNLNGKVKKIAGLLKIGWVMSRAPPP